MAGDNGVAPGGELKGYDLARKALEEARAAAAAAGKDVGRGRASTGRGGSGRRRRRGWTGPGPDRNDPQTLGSLLRVTSKQRGWEEKVTEGRLISSWPRIVGSEIAEHCAAQNLTDGVLLVTTDSTAWATQLRLMQRNILRVIAAEWGPRRVSQLKIQGPSAPSWRKGERHVRGRGPRDTYG